MGNDQRRTSLVSPNPCIIILHFHPSNNCSTLTITPTAECTKLVSINSNSQNSQKINFPLAFSYAIWYNNRVKRDSPSGQFGSLMAKPHK